MSLEMYRWLCRKSAVLAAALSVVLPSARALSNRAGFIELDPVGCVADVSRAGRALAVLVLCLSCSDANAAFPATPLQPASWTGTSQLMCSSCAGSAWCANHPTLVQTTIAAMADAHAAINPGAWAGCDVDEIKRTYTVRNTTCAGNVLATCTGQPVCAQGVATNPPNSTSGTCQPSQPYTCPAGATLSGTTCTCNSPLVESNGTCVPPDSGDKNTGIPDCGKEVRAPVGIEGNPCNAANGNKIEQQLVYRGLNGFEFLLTFNSFDSSAARFDTHWRDSFDRRLRVQAANVRAYRPDGKALQFVPSGSAWVTDADTADRLVTVQNPPGTIVGWQYFAAQGDQVESYDAAGRLLSVKARNGLTQTFTYSDGTGWANGGFVLDANGNPTSTPLPLGLLIRASDHFGRTLSFGYDSLSRVIRLTDPANGVYRFAYDASKNLASITFPDKTTRSYVYNEPAHTGGANLPTALTGIVDENNQRFATFKYDAQQRAVATEHAGGAMKYLFSFGSGTTAVTSPLGAVRTYSFSTVLGVLKTSAITGPACPECGPASQTFDANGNVATRTDWNGNRADYGHDSARNLETSRIEALTSAGSTTAQTRTITTQWHADYRLPTGIAEPLRITTMVFGATSDPNPGNRGSLLSRTIQATTDTNGSQGFGATATGTPRTWSYTYNANGSVLTVDGPRTDVADVTNYAYYANDAMCPGANSAGCRGQIQTITNAAGHVTQITEYNAHGQLLTIVDPNGLITALGYDARQRLISRNVGGETTGYEYDSAGQLKKVTLPDSSFLSYAYDAAHRLIEVADNLGNKIVYTLDAMGNRTEEKLFSATDSVNPARKMSREYSNLNRLFREIGGTSPATQVTEYGYDNQGNVTSIDGPLSGMTDRRTLTYDALSRLATMVDPAGSVGGTTTYGYNGLDQLTSVTDPRTLVTSYSYDGLNNLDQQSSPDTGATGYTFDAAGNVLTQTDAKGQVTSYSYNVLNRVATATYQGGVVHTYTYDQGTNQRGRLTQIAEPASTTVFVYDVKGRLSSETRTISAVAYVTSYGYDSFGRLNRITYPGGRQVNYTFDVLGRIASISTTKNGITQTLLGGAAYQPFGGIAQFTFGDGQVYRRGYDLDGRVSTYSLGSLTQVLTYDATGRITQIQDQGGGATRGFGYDVLDRLISATIPGNNQTYAYDANGNRTSRNADSYTYFSNTNRLQTAGSVSYAYDNNGSATTAGPHTLFYDTRGRLVQAQTAAGNADYTINALGQRIIKQFGGITTVFHYDQQGRLIAESSGAGVVQREYVYLYDQPVSLVVPP